jgi:hypothetical protein
MSKTENSKTQDLWLGLNHISKQRLEQFASGHLELNETELAHATVCEKCSNRIAGLALSEVEQKGDHAGLRGLWDKLFHR